MGKQAELQSNAAPNASRFGTKAKAILAGGLVLGVGAAITLAAWTDQEWATGIFGTGSFGIEGSIDGAAFSENPDESDPAMLAFGVDAAALTPGDEVYALFSVQLIAGSNYEANVTITTDTDDAIDGTVASYVEIDGTTCDKAAYDAATATENDPGFTLATQVTPANFCFKVAADNTLEQNATGSITWTFDATQGSEI